MKLLACALIMLFSQISMAVEPNDVVYFWAHSKYAECEGFSDLVAVRANQVKLRELAAGECKHLPTPSLECFTAADQVLSPKFDTLAHQQQCTRSKVNIPSAGGQQTSHSGPPYSITSACTASSFVGPTSVSSADGTHHVCKRRVKCPTEFLILGKKFPEGTYEITCRVSAGFSCSNIGYDYDSCEKPTIQEIGIIFNGDVTRLPGAGVQ